jgi:hypothetical protein
MLTLLRKCSKRSFSTIVPKNYREITDDDLFWLKTNEMKNRNFIYSHPSLNRNYFIQKKTKNNIPKNIIGNVVFGDNCEGKPSYVHGGALSAILDEVMGFTCFVNNLNAVTYNLNVNYYNSIKLNSEIIIEASIEKKDNDNIIVTACLKSKNIETMVLGKSIWKFQN